ncbi:MAG: murein biosynthesis integral membrane protein MurJ [Gammaproteobacteria bacterium]|nr:murein biosynthesis integral membrane protein MurJ [Gammaproteobacteria bacterium]MCH9715484.1 murein biosynthesis integral membrane protein MurJ [Gammaproteobacteria bacterium]MCH9763922.1 murein biosynthesis integral membrane protein MurJ [Gammaproteobacteria bacterium]
MDSTEVITHKKRGLLRSTSVVSLLTFFSRIMGFVRDMVLAQCFGAAAGMDAFIIAFRIPNFMRRLFAEGAFSQAFVPVLSEYQTNRSLDEVRLFLARIAGNLGIILLGVVIVGELIAPGIIFVFAPGFGDDAGRTHLAVHMLHLTLPYLMLISLTAMAGAVLNTYGYFGVPALTPIILNISLITAALYLSPHVPVPVTALAWGVLIGGCLQLLVQVPFLVRHRFLMRPRVMFRDPGVLRVLKLMLPALFGVSIAQINLLIDTVFASFLQVGSVTWLFYTDRLIDFPLGVFGVAIATVILPHLSRKHIEESTAYFSRSIDWGLRLLLLIGVPASVGLILFGMPLLSSFFGYHAFKVFDVLQTQQSLMTLALGVPAFMMVKVLAPGFYAQQDIKTPVKVGAFCMILNTILCAILISPLAHAGLTLASAVSGYANAFSLLFLLWRRGSYQPSPGWRRFILQLLLANIVLGAYLIWAAGDLSDWMGVSMHHRLMHLLSYVFSAGAIYFVCLGLTGMRFGQFRGQFLET